MDMEFKKPVILVVDNESDMCEMFVAILYGEGYLTDMANSGKDAVKKVKDGGVDFVLLDIMMPKMGGIETLQQIKAVRPDIPIVMITAYATLKTAQEAMRLGAYDYITKPFNPECVKEVIKQGLEEQYTNTVTVHPHLNLPPPPLSLSVRGTGRGIQGNNEYSPPLVGGVKGWGEPLPNT